jgi:hypothetical protein
MPTTHTTEEHTMNCTTRTSTGTCGKPAVYTETSAWRDTTFAECAECAAAPGSLYSSRHMAAGAAPAGDHRVGDTVQVRRYGKVYDATVTRVTRTGAAYATFRYGNGAERTVRATTDGTIYSAGA